jgi:hypothetical protein
MSRKGFLKSNQKDNSVAGFPASKLDDKWIRDSIGTPLVVGTECWTNGEMTSDGRLVVQLRRDGKMRDFAIIVACIEYTDQQAE